MRRLIRLASGLVILVVGGILLVRYSETAFLSLVGNHTDATVVGTCSQEQVLIAKRAPSCPATWGASPGVRGRIVGADVASGDVVPVQIVVGTAYVVPTGTSDVVLGYVAPIVMAIGFGMIVARGPRRT
jgi:hypothetical protein